MECSQIKIFSANAAKKIEKRANKWLYENRIKIDKPLQLCVQHVGRKMRNKRKRMNNIPRFSLIIVFSVTVKEFEINKSLPASND